MYSILPGKMYFPFLAHMVITRYCNLSCGYCNEFSKTAHPVPLERLRRQIDRLQELGTLALTLSGGEPLSHPGIFEILGYANGKFMHLGIITNAYLLSEAVIEKLNATGLNSLQISIDGVFPNPVTVKALKPLRSKLNILTRKAKFTVNINSVVGSTPYTELVEIIEYARSRWFTSTVQVVHDSEGQTLLGEDERESYSRIMKKVHNPFWNLAWAQTRRLITRGSAPFACRAGSRYLYINEFGDVCWCAPTQKRFSKPLEAYTPEDLKSQFYLKKGCEERCTLGCARSASRLEEFRRYALPEIGPVPACQGDLARRSES